MALTKQTMTDEQRKSVAIEYLKAFDNGGRDLGRAAAILDLFAEDAQVYFPKWGLANGKEQIGQMFGDVGGTLKSIVHHYSHFNWIFSGSDLVVCEGTSHGEHKDGPWRAGRARVGGRPLVRRVRDPRLEDPALLHLSRSRLCRQGHRPLSLAEEQIEAADRHRLDGTERFQGRTTMNCDLKAMRPWAVPIVGRSDCCYARGPGFLCPRRRMN